MPIRISFSQLSIEVFFIGICQFIWGHDELKNKFNVDFDDFFLFADHFGTAQGETGYDARFDIVPNGRIDFGDFFRFADDFGKVVANASVISGG